MPSLLKTDARCPVCDKPIIAICRCTRRESTSLEFVHSQERPINHADHVIYADDDTMSVIFKRLSVDPSQPPEAT